MSGSDPAALIAALDKSFVDGDHRLRPVHTFGIGVSGFFEASDVARNYCLAEHFQPQPRPIPVTARFSNGSGSSQQHDGWSDVRGLATRFHLPSGGATDLLAMTLNAFFTPDIETFLAFSEATIPRPVTRDSTLQKLLDMLHLLKPLSDPPAGQTMSATAGATAFAASHPGSQLPIFQAADLGAPASYARAAYHAVHTFVVTAPDGTRRRVRFNWQPVEGVLPLDPELPHSDQYLASELRARLADAPARFVLMMAIGEAGDDFDNPARPWPPHRSRVVMGALTLTRVPEDQSEECERLSFNPWLLVPGIEPSEDPILQARREAYQYSSRRRGASPCPFARGAADEH